MATPRLIETRNQMLLITALISCAATQHRGGPGAGQGGRRGFTRLGDFGSEHAEGPAGPGAETPVRAACWGGRAAVFLVFAGYAPAEVGSSLTTTDFEVGVLLTAAVESSGTRTLVSGK
ncbi:hypothetical protein GCM10010321_38500 [Streptomyces chartreusis]|nr:hypothetical protein GCM10010321_38500 [Streptomyces chartreusis]